MERAKYSRHFVSGERVFLRSNDIGMKNDDVYLSANHSASEDNIQPQRRKWPLPVWLILTILGVFYHRKVIRKRICYACYVEEVSYNLLSEDNWCKEPLLLDPICLEYEYDGDKWAYENRDGLLPLSHREQANNCDVCNMTARNCLGEANKYSDVDIGVTSWNSPYSKSISILGITSAMAFILFDFGYYVYYMLGDKRQLLHFISYSCILACLSIYPVLNICSKVRSFFGKNGKFEFMTWATTLNLRFIAKRLQVLDLPKKGLPGKLFLTLCLLWPSCNAFFRISIYAFIIKSPITVYLFCTLVGVGAVMIMWGCFAYVLYLMRLSFQREFKLILSYLKKKEGDLDNCRNCLSHVMLDFNCFRKFIKLYMEVMVPFTVLGVTANVTWQYRLSETCRFLRYRERVVSIDMLKWSNTAMFILLNLIAIGGLDVNGIWDNFLSRIIQMQTAMHYSFWRKIFTHLKRNQGDYSTTNLTMVYSVISLYMGLQLEDDQEVSHHHQFTECFFNVTQPTYMMGYSVF